MRYRFWDNEKDEEAATDDLKTAVKETMVGEESCFVEDEQSKLPEHLFVGRELGLNVSYFERNGNYQVTYKR